MTSARSEVKDTSIVSEQKKVGGPLASKNVGQVDDTFGDVSCIQMAADTHDVGLLNKGEELGSLADESVLKK